MWNWNSNGLPFLPGFSFPDVTKSNFHLSQTLGYKNGFPLPSVPTITLGEDPLVSEEMLQQELSRLVYEPTDVKYGAFYKSHYDEFIPSYVILDKKVLCFHAYFVEQVLFSRDENHCVRPVSIYYFLEDDSISLYEPRVENSRLPQGKRLKRQRVPKNNRGQYYHYTDLNLGMDLHVYGYTYRITNCDKYTRNFLESEGIIVNEPESTPDDPYTKSRVLPLPTHMTPSQMDKRYQFLTMDGMVLCFLALWDNTDALYGETRPISIHYYLVDDTLEVREVHEPNSGRDPFPVIMQRTKLPKKLKAQSFPSCCLEITNHEVEEYYTPRDFQLGQKVTLMGRSFMLHDCNDFTKEYYKNTYPDMEMKPVEIPKKVDVYKNWKFKIPPYNGFGSLEDSLQNCLALVPERPKKDVIKMLENDRKVLHYCAILDTQNPADKGRRFVLSYYLSNDVVSIFEVNTRNSGIMGGKFLEKTRIPKPGTSVDNPEYYSPGDFEIGSTVEVFSHRFVLTDAADFVLTYMESIADRVPARTLESLRRVQAEDAANKPPGDQNTGDEAAKSSS